MFVINKTKSLVISSIATALLTISFGSQAAAPTSAAVTITAKVIENTCAWDTGGGDKQVDFGNVTTENLDKGVDTSKEFHLQLKDCPDNMSVTAVVTGSETGDYFTPAVSSTAKNIGLKVFAKDNSQIKNTQAAPVEISAAGKIDIKFKASLFRNGGTPVAGDASFPLVINLSYK